MAAKSVSKIRTYLIAGMLVWLPLAASFWVVTTLMQWMDKSLLLIPAAYRPEELLGFHIPGLGVLLTLAILFVTGVVAANLFGRELVKLWERLLFKIPLVRSVYSSVKQLLETMFADNGNSFRKVVLVEFPRPGIWALGFLTGTDQGEAQRMTGHDVVNVYVPTTPNPTGGYFVMIPKCDVKELKMSVDDGLKMLLSMGAVVPDVLLEKAELAPPEIKP
ncbi:MAG: DUF502 domain-containing protein [Candidatus Polarisedimenticolaceae bacterium]|nr:DUF502 domain-containing protein [Candidatus Polarisedimenticolaceae bacterium]